MHVYVVVTSDSHPRVLSLESSRTLQYKSSGVSHVSSHVVCVSRFVCSSVCLFVWPFTVVEGSPPLFLGLSSEGDYYKLQIYTMAVSYYPFRTKYNRGHK